MNTASDSHDGLDIGLTWNNSFSQLGEDFYTRLAPQPLPAPYWVGRSSAAAAVLGLDPSWLDSSELLEAVSGNRRLAGGATLASVYSGHQFGMWAGQLGDGRALLLGETGAGMEVQLKGAGLTPYSRMGDGRAVLRSSIREFLCSEAMHGLGIPTSRALCVIGSDAPIRRETIETAAVVTRLAPSFVRFGHFEHFSHGNQHDQLKALADYTIDRHYPECRTSEEFAGNPYAALLQAVSERTAIMVAQWQSVGFCHGVMNTDNMSILGLTIDYGPFQFLDAYNPGHICNHSDNQGRYAFNKQPNMAYWNLYCLGQALLPLIGEQEPAIAALESYKTVFPAEFGQRMGAKLGLMASQGEMSALDRALIEDILKLLAADRVDYTIFWRRLSHSDGGRDAAAVRDLFLDRVAADAWLLRYSERIKHIPRGESTDLMLKTNPKFVLRNHLGEQAIKKAKLKDFSEVNTLLTLLESPFEEHKGFEEYAGFPPEWAAGIEISCSS
ncbi:protein adenylyltransferase SelO [Rhodoferax sp.]|uniref:protein adenylyltransferase SelO n=1 Tax=Rhodoferax sp. TaxID=50421 RepID=UPI001EC4879C|nr:YdiU family protein [Rhodoferax sp.]MBT9506652.1 YdiU family protein [Rhodoferax sp.]